MLTGQIRNPNSKKIRDESIETRSKLEHGGGPTSAGTETELGAGDEVCGDGLAGKGTIMEAVGAMGSVGLDMCWILLL